VDEAASTSTGRTAQTPPALAAKPSLAVLPFRTLSEDPQQDYLGDGIAEDLITDLSRLRNMTVIARSSSFRYRGQSPTAEQVGKELKVSHLLEGSVRRAGDRVRVTVQLVETGTGQQLWAERFDRVLDDIFAIQDEIAKSIVAGLSVELVTGEQGHLGGAAAKNFAAYDSFLRGQKAYQEYSREGNIRARALYREAIAIDPTFGRAYGALAISLARGSIVGWEENLEESLDQALTLARQAVRLAPYAPQTHWALGYTLLMRREYKEAFTATEQAVELAPNYADGYGLLALISNGLGEADDAIRYIRKGMELNPYYSWDYPYNLGRALYLKGQYQEAVGQLKESLTRNPSSLNPRLYLAAALLSLGQTEDAEWEVLQIRTDYPEVSLSSISTRIPTADGPWKEKFLADLATAGLEK